ncbi:hypothetical protein EMIT047CA2_10452 [Pseudomonas soli]
MKKSLTASEKIYLIHPVAQIAQSVEQRIENPRVGGSTPSLGTTFSFWWLQSYPKRHKKPA